MTSRSAWLTACLLGLAVSIIQVAWLMVVPPFAGMDEFDHAYRAASVARGHLAPVGPAQHGYGALLVVPADIPLAAHHACEVRVYTGPDNCTATTPPDRSGDVLVASSAGNYNPVYYAIVGTVARPFAGVNALYAMRAATILLCDAFLMGSLVVTCRCARSLWPVIGMLVLFTPVMIESMSIAAPNGIELAAGIAMWSAGLAYVHGDKANARHVLLFAAVSAAAVSTLHTTGPVWVFFFLCVMAILLGRAGLADLLRNRRGSFLACVLIVGVTTFGALAWIVTHGTNDPRRLPLATVVRPVRWSDFAGQVLLWILQTMGGIPFREQVLPGAVFAIGLILFAVLMVSAARAGNGREWVASLLIVLATLGIPLALTIVTYTRLGFAWQGRYAMPLACGLPLIAGWVIQRGRPPARIAWVFALLTVLGAVAAQLIAEIHVRNLEAQKFTGYPGLALPTDSVLVLLTAAALAAAAGCIAKGYSAYSDGPRGAALGQLHQPQALAEPAKVADRPLG